MKLNRTEIEILQEEIKNLQRENQSLKDTVEVYQNQLEKVIEYHSVEKYRATVQRNRKAEVTTSI